MKTTLGLPPEIWAKRATLAKAMGWIQAQALGALAEIWCAAVELGATAADADQLASWAGVPKREAKRFLAELRRIDFIADGVDGLHEIWLAAKKIRDAETTREKGRKRWAGERSPAQSPASSPTRSPAQSPASSSAQSRSASSAHSALGGAGGALSSQSFTPPDLHEDSSVLAASSSPPDLGSHDASPRARALMGRNAARALASAAATDCRRVLLGAALRVPTEAPAEAATSRAAYDAWVEECLRAALRPETLELVLEAYGEGCIGLRGDFLAFCRSERARVDTQFDPTAPSRVPQETLEARFEALLFTRFKNLLAAERLRPVQSPRGEITYEPAHQEDPH